jgi:hypothetical protein
MQKIEYIYLPDSTKSLEENIRMLQENTSSIIAQLLVDDLFRKLFIVSYKELLPKFHEHTRRTQMEQDMAYVLHHIQNRAKIVVSRDPLYALVASREIALEKR